MVWWDWKRWEQEIDWMALNGINMPLAVLGQNAIWQRVYKEMGFSAEDLQKFFSGPAYSAFNWMGVLDNWGGPLPQSLIDAHEELQKKILERQRSLGMKPVLPAFTGHVPAGLRGKYPKAKINTVDWQGFPKTSVLDPNDPLFKEIGRRFITEQTKTFGTDHLYSADTFIEMIPPSADSLFLNDMSDRTYESMAAGDPQAVWVMQGWMFHYLSDFWKPVQIKALLNAVPNDKMIILDLFSENNPVWSRTDGYYGKPWIWCMLHNFGGNISLYGRMENVAKDPANALHDKRSGQMLGIGLTPEGIEQNPVMYALMMENTWRDSPIDLDQWLPGYVARRYGQKNINSEKAWTILKRTVYNGNLVSGGPESIITGRPTLETKARWARTALHYDPAELLKAWGYQIQAAEELKNSQGFQYDLVDLGRQVLANYANVLQQKFAAAYKENKIEDCEKYSGEFLTLIDDLDLLLATRKEFLLGTWLEDAKGWGADTKEKKLYEKNARNILTTWGDKDSRLHDYACRQWSGLLKGFYKARWKSFFDYLKSCRTEKKAADLKQFENTVKDWEWKWVNSNETYVSEPQGDPVLVSTTIYTKYLNAISAAYNAKK
jgi:alpha-N-acetylglucosaminidase